jgi:hypothetical protein
MPFMSTSFLPVGGAFESGGPLKPLVVGRFSNWATRAFACAKVAPLDGLMAVEPDADDVVSLPPDDSFDELLQAAISDIEHAITATVSLRFMHYS